MDSGQENKSVVELVQEALRANTEHLQALEAYLQSLEVDLESLDKLLDAVDTTEEPDLDIGSIVTIPGSVRATAPVLTKELLSLESPFYGDAAKRSRYKNASEVRPMKARELGALAEAVQAECYRKHALDVQKRGSLASLNIDWQAAPTLGLNGEDIDWNRIAEKVSAISMNTNPRAARECEIRWLGEQHPEFNHTSWTEAEKLEANSLVTEFVTSLPDWGTIAKRLGTKRTPLDCMRHAASRKSHRWTTEADERLLKAIDMYGHENWYLVARYVSEDVTPSQCSNRYQKTLDASVKRTTWSPEEDARLSAAVAAYGSSWVDVATCVPGRHNDQCRERWTEQLDPSINKSHWSEKEDKLLTDYVHEHKNASWKQISEYIGNGRTEAMCRNRYTALQKDASTDPAMLTAESGVRNVTESSDFESVGSKTLRFRYSLPSLQTRRAPLGTEHGHSNQIVFLEPVVSSNPEVHQYHKPHPTRYTTRFKTTTDGIPPLNTIPSPKKRKKRSRTLQD